jgi:hypothetical protein
MPFRAVAPGLGRLRVRTASSSITCSCGTRGPQGSHETMAGIHAFVVVVVALAPRTMSAYVSWYYCSGQRQIGP